jgi:isocitrate dehydrogenase
MTHYTISVAYGDGIGPEIMDAVLNIFIAAEVPLNYEFVEMGKKYFEQGYSNGMSAEAQHNIEKNGVLFKGPMETPKGAGMKSINVTARKFWSTFANRRHFRSLKGVDTVYSKAGIPIDITIVRENIEDTYGGIEHLNTHDLAVSRRFISRPGSMQVHRFAFEMAKKEGLKKVSCGHKANIMKITDGLFLETFYEVAKDYPEIDANDIIVDDLCMKLVVDPKRFEVVVLPNLQGDIVSDLCAGLVGGLGFAPSANIGERISIFEAVHGTAPDIAGKNIANPTSLLLSGLMMLKHLGLQSHAVVIENALLRTLEDGVHTGDFGDRVIPASDTSDFAQAIIANLGRLPKESRPKIAQPDFTWVKPEPSTETIMMTTEAKGLQSIDGFDVFIESSEDPKTIVEKLKHIIPAEMNLQNISNRGTQVWPNGSYFTECINHYGLRFLCAASINKAQFFSLMAEIDKIFSVVSFEMLLNLNGKRGYSLAQGE